MALLRDGEPSGKPGHGIVYNHSVIVLCDSCGSGFIEVLNHDCFDFEEVFDQSEWFAFDRASAGVLRSALSSCAQPLEASCDCGLHRSLRKTPLSIKPRTAGFQAASHVQMIAIVVEDGLPSIDRGANQAPAQRQGMESD
jgi:hypothetical protein